MNIIIRHEKPEDYRAVEELTREAFWGLNQPDCDEHYLAHTLRKSPGFVPELDFVAILDGRLVGNVMFSIGRVTDSEGNITEVLNFGPLSVLPEYQNMGIGKALMNHAIAEAKRLGYRAILFFGHPDYYPRLGFKRASEYGILTADGSSFDAFMAMELVPGALMGKSGRYHEDPLFKVNKAEAEEFDKGFPPKEKAVPIPIDILLEQLEAGARDSLRALNAAGLSWMRTMSEREVRGLKGMDDNAINTIKRVMREHGFRWGEGNYNT